MTVHPKLKFDKFLGIEDVDEFVCSLEQIWRIALHAHQANSFSLHKTLIDGLELY